MNFNGEIHPAADAWPMLAGDELDDLAADIKANGLIQPIVLDAEGRLLDGRNRLAACKRAKVQPTFIEFEGDDPVAFVLSCNEHRRHLSKGQRAIAVARTAMTTEWSLREVSRTTDVGREFVRQASMVLEYAPDLADAVMAGTIGLNEAYNKAKDRKDDQASDAKKLEELQANASDLAEQVEAGTLTATEGHGVWKQREKDRVDTLKRYADQMGTALSSFRYLRSWLDGEPHTIGADQYLTDRQRADLAEIERELS